MFTPGWAAPARCVISITLALMILTPASMAQQATGQDQTVTAEQRKQIEAAKTTSDLTSLAKQFLANRKEAAARLCIEQICAKEPKLLTDPQVQTTSKQWNDFWFTCRAEIQAKKLTDKDAAGRVELARWLKQGGVFPPARVLAAKALRIDPNLSDAKALAAELESPIGLDFRYAIAKPVLLTEYTDQSVKVEPGRGSLLLLAPVRYRATEVRLMLMSSAIKVTADTGKPGRVLGLLLTEEPPEPVSGATGGTGGAFVTAPPPTPSGPTTPPDQPPDSFTNTFYERLQIELKNGEPILVWQNTMTSRPMPTPGTPGAGYPRGTVTPRGATGGSTGLSAREALARKRGEMPAKGWLGLLVKFPEDAAKLTIELPEASPETIDINLLKLVQQQPQTGATAAGRPDERLNLVSKFAADPSAPTAQLAIAWMGATLSPQMGTPGQTNPMEVEILRTLLAAAGHPDRRVRLAGFDGLNKYSGQLADEALDYLRERADEKIILGLLEQIESALSVPADPNTTVAPPSTPTSPTAPALTKILEAMPLSPAPANVFAMLGACVNCKNDKGRQEALRILLQDGSRQSLQILSGDLHRDTLKALTVQFGRLQNPERKAAVLRMLLVPLKPDNSTITSVLAACGELSVKVTSEDDPLLTALKAEISPKAKQGLLQLLARSDLSAIAASQNFGAMLKSISDNIAKEAGVKSALLAMAASHLSLPYQSPISRGVQPGATPPEQAGGAFEALLALGISDSAVDQATAEKAATTLVKSGRINELKKQFEEAKDAAKRQGVIRALGKNKELWNRESLVIFLASTLGGDNEDILKEALSTLTLIHDNSDKNNRWRVNLGIQQGVDVNKLVELTTHPTARLAEQASALIKRTVGMTSKEAEDFDNSPNPQARLSCLNERILAERTQNPVGQYACLVLVDAEAEAQPGAVASPTGAPAGPVSRSSIPLASATVTVKRDNQNVLSIIADEVELARFGGEGTGADAAPPAGTLPIEAGELLRAALRSDDARKEGLYGKVDLSAAKAAANNQKCELKPDPLGGWSGEIAVTAPAAPPPGGKPNPIRITAAKVILQPLMP